MVTTGGIHGTVTGLDDATVTLRVADQVKITFDRGAIGRVVEGQGEKDALGTSGCGSVSSPPSCSVSLWYLYPPKQRINLGLDLQGGIHLVLGVDTNKAIANQTERAAEDFKAALERKGIGVKRIAREGDRAFVVELASPASWNDALTVASQFQTFERRNNDQAAGRFTLAMSDREVSQQRDLATRGAVEKIRNRVDKFGVAEATITRQGDDRILIQLPGVQDPDRAKALIGQTGLLEFKLLDERTPVEEALAGRLPESSEVLYQRRVDPETKAGAKVPFVVQKRTLLTGNELTDAERAGGPELAGQLAGVHHVQRDRRAALRRDHRAERRPSPRDHPRRHACTPRRASTSAFPGGRAVITGQFTVDQARDLAIVLREGALPAAVSHSRGAHGRAVARRRLDPAGRDRDRGVVGARLPLHADLLPALRPHRRRRPRPERASSCSPAWRRSAPRSRCRASRGSRSRSAWPSTPTSSSSSASARS